MPLRALGPEHVLEVIQAAIAPVVLISGVGLLLLTLSGRLGRIVDRTRIVASERNQADGERRGHLEQQLAILGHRARLVRLALALSASGAHAEADTHFAEAQRLAPYLPIPSNRRPPKR